MSSTSNYDPTANDDFAYLRETMIIDHINSWIYNT